MKLPMKVWSLICCPCSLRMSKSSEMSRRNRQGRHAPPNIGTSDEAVATEVAMSLSQLQEWNPGTDIQDAAALWPTCDTLEESIAVQGSTDICQLPDTSDAPSNIIVPSAAARSSASSSSSSWVPSLPPAHPMPTRRMPGYERIEPKRAQPKPAKWKVRI